MGLKTNEERLTKLEVSQEILYSKQVHFEERFERMNESLNSLVRLKHVIVGACLILPLCCSLLIYNVSRAIDLNDGQQKIIEEQQKMITIIQIEYAAHEKFLQQYGNEIENLKLWVNKHFK